jgi:hypothetical protein
MVNEKGFQRIDTASPQTVTTNAEGKATIVFTEPGIHRIKATVGAPGEETVVRSNRLDVCVPAAFGDCGEASPTVAPAVTSPVPPVPSTPTSAATRISKPKLDRGRIAAGKVGVSWKLLDPGAGIAAWRIASKTLGGKGGFVTRASGRQQTAATIRLPPGATYRLRFALTDLSGHITTYSLGKVTVPRGGKS